MEVHHHPHVGKKKFMEYILEGFMIFVAVSMGFIAENIREIIQKHEKETELMLILHDDLKADTAKMNTAIQFNNVKMLSLDSLRHDVYRISAVSLPDTVKRKMFYLYRAYTGNIGFFIPSIRAMSQLEKGDAFALIRKQTVSDSILFYKEMNDRTLNQYETFRDNQSRAREFGQQIFNPQISEEFLTRDQFANILHATRSFDFLDRDRKLTYQYAACLMDCRAVLFNYIKMIRDHREAATRLMHLLEKEYDIKSE